MASYRDQRPLLAVALALLGSPATPGYAQESGPRIELYTMGPGDYLFSKFGHAALCVVGPGEGVGRCFNYGTTDFSTPGPLAWAVLRGRAEFWVSVAPIDQMLAFYRAEDRTTYRQVLPLVPEQVAQMVRALATSALPENRRYLYDHFLDNCSTRPRDHIDAATGGALRSDPDSSPDRFFTYRTLIRETLADDPFYFLLAEAFLGRPMERERSEFEAMFLPYILRDAVATDLHVTPEVVYARRAAPSGPALIVRYRVALALGIGLVGALIILMASRRISSVGRRLFASGFGVLGSALWAVAMLSPVSELRFNEILLVFLPTDFLLLLGSERVTRYYSGIRVAELLLLCFLRWLGVLIQPLVTFLSLALPVLTGTWARALAARPLPR
ncbi:MAG: DUF4105 domain-containing protein [Vicinamibacteria bacterium]